MANRYRTNLKKVFLTDQELTALNNRISQSRCKTFSAYARKILLNPNMTFLTIDTSNYDDLVFELKRIGNNLNQIARTVNQTHILTPSDREFLMQGIGQLIKEVEKDFNIKCQQLKEFYGRH
ncbi:TPA: plasmid mobilization relaxosome protein MobC [Streptococcus suis]|nr:plasmid mobilization relaxosome protein MobC [Streptococcus suis]HEM3615788.1 plasmid mobilization relaxosome protein MobC [Streptococcus suis]HEM3618871.1 plasmid mobilization relaxosome protein MobC [Streptococcus suis]HEM3620651.1 plasmid mobilization relaxosome protein MobC [Streptococcus suis]HEM3637354.1 plasmid mobilization relaxosome protein MobC [Streptococcus suis]